METILISLPQSGEDIVVVIERKLMKTCRLKVFPTKEVKISVPSQTTEDWIKQYLNSKSEWIEKKLEAFKRTSGYAATSIIKNGMSITMLGQNLIFSVRKSEKEYVYLENNILHMCILDLHDTERILYIFEKWWKEQGELIYQEYLDKIYPIVGKYNIPKPKIQIRKMKTLWGSCSPHRNLITLNFYLMKARPACIEYIILHELSHFIHPNHSKAFYDFVSIAMPDWKDRKQLLDHEVVQGL